MNKTPLFYVKIAKPYNGREVGTIINWFNTYREAERFCFYASVDGSLKIERGE